MSDIIPFEIQREILKRVPDVKSLLQFRSVSKSWRSVIDSPQFIADYHPQPPRHHILVWYRDHIKTRHVSFIDNNNKDDSCFAQHMVPLTLPFSEPHGFEIYGSCKGLFCLYGGHSKKRIAVLWNPSIRKSVTIDLPQVSYAFKIVFGVSPYSSDPKLVKIQTFVHVLDMKPRLVEIYSLSTGEWRTLSSSSEDLPRSSVAFDNGDNCQVAIGNFICCRAYDMKYENGHRHIKQAMIMFFDMISEKFMEIYIPDNVTENPYDDLTLFKIRESLAVVVRDVDVHVSMMEGGVSDSFTKMYTIPTRASFPAGTRYTAGARFSLLAFRNNGHPIIRMYDDEFAYEYVVVYEPDSKKFTRIGASESDYTRYVGSYMETLLLLDH